MAQRKPYNPNTQYGRKKLREQATENYNNLDPESKKDADFIGCIFVIVIAIIGFLLFGPKWFH